MPDTHEKLNQGWHLDKRVPVAIIIGMLVQLTLVVWFIADLDNRVENNEERISTLMGAEKLQTEVSQRQAVSLARIEEQIAGLRDDINRLVRVIGEQ